ncbi:ABC transporter substrate-binding protein [Diplocloster agilis]|uniref:ABC transporter substrate-binding protein n=1 Tax=Diplocloster agilis TaxID=2850323 RepID=UPI000820D7C0|nr:extracellular solute-binding protein [Suonthocola fibrivorans]MCU6733065.1 extracellular solute-binding protein [Suonthocola fibrivorans]SCI74353.1 glycerol-3-phosphate transporter periplasmic binding protein [uncultured Clostridium sp.]
MKFRKVLSVTLAAAMTAALVLAGCGSKPAEETADNQASAGEDKRQNTDAESADQSEQGDKNGGLPTVTFTHGYYHDESEWAAAGEMRKIYQEFADAHKDEFNFVIVADESGAEGIYNTALNDISAGEFYDIADFGGWDIVPVAANADMILDLKPYLDEDAAFKAGVGVCYDQNLTEDGKIYSVREQIEGVGFWYNQALFDKADAVSPDQWQTWADFDAAVEKLTAAGITPFGLNAGWPTNILAAAYSQRDDASRTFYKSGRMATSFDDPTFKETLSFIQTKTLQKVDAANFGPGGDDDEQYRTDFFEGNTAMLFNGVWDAGGSVDCKAGAENIRPAVFPTSEAGKKASLLSGGTGFVVSSKLDEAQTQACIEFIKYMTSEEIANRIISAGIGMAPSTAVDYKTLADSVDTADAKLLVQACGLCQNADYQALGWGNTFGDAEGEIQAKYAGLKDGSKTVDDVVKELDQFLEAAE